ncbi:tetratricopeptide repeat protein [Trichothermofontia sp.]
MSDTPAQRVASYNRQLYQSIKLAFRLPLRRQVLIAVCDDLALRNRIAARLQAELAAGPAPAEGDRGPSPPSHYRVLPLANQSGPTYARFVSLGLNLNNPNPLLQIAQWLNQNPPPLTPQGTRMPLPHFQILGVERLTRQPLAVQRLFLSYLQGAEEHLARLESGLLLWVSRPWCRAIQQSAPAFWKWRSGVFEFIGDPTVALPASEQPETMQLDNLELNHLASEAIAPTLGNSTATLSSQIWDILSQDLAKLDQSTLPGSEPPEANLQLLYQFTRQLSVLLAQATPQATFHTPVLSAPSVSLTAQGTAQGEAPPATATPRPAPKLPKAPASRPPQPPTQKTFELRREVPHHPLREREKVSLAQVPVAKVPVAVEAVPAGARRLPEAAPTQCTEGDPSRTHPASASLEARGVATAPPSSPRSYVPAALTELVLAIATQPGQREDVLPPHSHALQLLQHLESLHEQQVLPRFLVAAYLDLGNFYRDRLEQGEITQANLQAAILAYEQVLAWLDEDSALWSDVLNDLGNFHWMLARHASEPAAIVAYLEQAIRLYRQALASTHPRSQPQTLAMIQNNLGTAYSDLARYQEPAAHLQSAIAAYQAALTYRQADTEPLKYAATQNNLGTAYWNLAQYEQPIAHLRQAIATYTEALRYHDLERDPLGYAMIQNNLGTAYWNLAQHEQPQAFLQLAIRSYQVALRYRTPETAPAAHAATLNNLGTAYWHLANHTPEEAETRLAHLRQSIATYEQAIAATDRLKQQSPNTTLAFDLYATHNNLGLAHFQLVTDPQTPLDPAEKSQHLEAALTQHLIALQGWEGKPDLYQAAFSYVVQTVRTFYQECGLAGQNLALSLIPAHLLPQLLPRL